MSAFRFTRLAAPVLWAALILAPLAQGQPGAAPAGARGEGRGMARGMQGPAVISPEVGADRRVTFRLLAPQAQSVRLNTGDIPGTGGSAGALAKGENGLWSLTVGPLDPGAYRYKFTVDRVDVIDPRNPATSESNETAWNLFLVPGSDLMDTRDVPHGAVAEVNYYSTALGRFRRMHIYTPPGYEAGQEKYPVFYLLHGALDTDDAWHTVGRADTIIDNLIAAKKAVPMIVVMPAGHTTRNGMGNVWSMGLGRPDDFVRDFVGDVMPYVEKHYRVLTDRAHRAIAGLSMGGNQTLNIAIPRLDQFAYIGVYSSGLLGGFGGGRGRGGAVPDATAASAAPIPWEQQNLAALDNAELKKGLKLLWFKTGREDGLITTTRATVAVLEKHGFKPTFQESAGAHTWSNWRDYLIEFAPQLFQ